MSDEPKFSKQALLKDPLIRQMMKADGVSHDELDRLLTEVATRLASKGKAIDGTVVFDLETIESRLDPRFAPCKRLLCMQCPDTVH